MITVITLILALGVIAGVCYVSYRSEQLDELDRELSEESAELEERLNRLAAEEETTRMLNIKLRDELDRRCSDDSPEIYASYAISESDRMKYKSDKAIMNVAKNRLAHILGNDIVRQFPQPQCDSSDGREIYYYKFKIKELS